MDIRLTEEQREILSGRICPYCHVPTEYKNSIEVYGVDYGMIYYCPQCGAYYVFIREPTEQRLETGYYAKFTNGCIEIKDPQRHNQYAPGEFYAVTESDIWLMRYHKNILFAVNCKTTRKNKFEIKVFIFGN